MGKFVQLVVSTSTPNASSLSSYNGDAMNNTAIAKETAKIAAIFLNKVSAFNA